MRYLTYAVLILVFSVGCVDTGGTPEVPDGGVNANCPMPTAADLQPKLFSLSCAFTSCHDASSKRADFDASSMAATCTSLKNNTPSCEFPPMSRAQVLPAKLSCASS